MAKTTWGAQASAVFVPFCSSKAAFLAPCPARPSALCAGTAAAHGGGRSRHVLFFSPTCSLSRYRIGNQLNQPDGHGRRRAIVPFLDQAPEMAGCPTPNRCLPSAAWSFKPFIRVKAVPPRPYGHLFVAEPANGCAGRPYRQRKTTLVGLLQKFYLPAVAGCWWTIRTWAR